MNDCRGRNFIRLCTLEVVVSGSAVCLLVVVWYCACTYVVRSDLANSLKLRRSCRCCFSGGVLGVGANVSPFSSTVSSSGVSDRLLRLWMAWLEVWVGVGPVFAFLWRLCVLFVSFSCSVFVVVIVSVAVVVCLLFRVLLGVLGLGCGW